MINDALTHAYRGLLLWDRRRIGVAVAAAAGCAVLIGVATVLIPNTFFARDVPPVWWDYPVWILTSMLLGMLIATYVRDPKSTPEARRGGPDVTDSAEDRAGDPDVTEAPESTSADRTNAPEITSENRSSVLGGVGGILGWFAVGCPVCNKIALLALGYTGALKYFAPFQPILAALSVALLLVAVIIRLRGQYACPVPREKVSRPKTSPEGSPRS